ncbi:hypothetical protein LUU34_01425900 [Aix galericulata]|nr:hypothetical protein LUU34_01425900 [Aix galericulata]
MGGDRGSLCCPGRGVRGWQGAVSGAVGMEPPGAGGAAPLWCPTAAPQPGPASSGAVGSNPQAAQPPLPPSPWALSLLVSPGRQGQHQYCPWHESCAASPEPGAPSPGGACPSFRGPWRGGSVERGWLPPSTCPRGALGPGAVGLPLARPWRSRSLRQVSLLSPAAACGARHPAPVPARRVNKAGSQLPALPPRHHVQPAAQAQGHGAWGTGPQGHGGTRAQGHGSLHCGPHLPLPPPVHIPWEERERSCLGSWLGCVSPGLSLPVWGPGCSSGAVPVRPHPASGAAPGVELSSGPGTQPLVHPCQAQPGAPRLGRAQLLHFGPARRVLGVAGVQAARGCFLPQPARAESSLALC